MKRKGRGSREHIQVDYQISILMIILAVLILAAVSFLISVWSVNRKTGISAAEKLFSEASIRIEDNISNQILEVTELAYLMKTLPAFSAPVEGRGGEHPALPYVAEVLRCNSYIYSMYSGSSDGDFIQLIKTSGDENIIEVHNAPPETEFILRTITGRDNERVQSWCYLDSGMNVLGDCFELTPEYSPAVRPWFLLSQQNSGDIIMTAPYVFNSLKKPGITASTALSEQISIGIDISLQDLNRMLNDTVISENAGILILDEDGRIVAANKWMEEKLSVSSSNLIKIEESRNYDAYLDLNNEDRLFREGSFELSTGNPGSLVITAPISDFTHQQQEMQRNIIISIVVILIISFPLIIVLSRSVGSFLKKLAEDAARIQHFDYSGALPGRSVIREFNQLGNAFGVMKGTLSERTDALRTAREKLEHIIDLGIAMSIEKDSDKLFELILKGAKQISHADGGSLYIRTEDDVLDFRIVLTDSLKFEQGGTSGNPVTLPGVPMFNAEGEPNYHNIVSYACHKCETVVIDDAYETEHFDFSGTRKFDEMNNYRSMSFLTVPLKLPGSEVMGAIQLLNSKSPETGETVPFSHDIQRFVEALSAEAAAILHNRNLVKVQEQLFESLIQLIADSIDTKSPYTGGHCKRVPELAAMLADEAEKSTEKYFSGFSFNDMDERRAFRIGAWLHDAGKITTPEYVVDKSVKLETIYNRIHEIRTRFEVLLRDVWLEEKDALLAGMKPDEAAKKRKQKEAELFEEYRFIASCNTGDYQPEPDWLERLNKIGRREWDGYFDHTIGLSNDEAAALTSSYSQGASVRNRLISDKTEHLVPYGNDGTNPYKDYDFRLERPEYLYNRGEIYNLSVPRGTLTFEERYKINEHIMQTIVMLDKLPMPRGMANIIAYAGGHHETLNGSGYPRKLSGEQISIPARIIAIADIFEALTASDRPYKSPKTLSQSISILNGMKEKGHIDPVLFELFLRSGVYRRYAGKFLKPEQIDDVDIEKFL